MSPWDQMTPEAMQAMAPKQGGLNMSGFDLKGPLAQFAMSMVQQQMQPQGGQMMPLQHNMGLRPQQQQQPMGMQMPQIMPLGGYYG
jgi:hypothetical protein